VVDGDFDDFARSDFVASLLDSVAANLQGFSYIGRNGSHLFGHEHQRIWLEEFE
jgi:hypothetical protein